MHLPSCPRRPRSTYLSVPSPIYQALSRNNGDSSFSPPISSLQTLPLLIHCAPHPFSFLPFPNSYPRHDRRMRKLQRTNQLTIHTECNAMRRNHRFIPLFYNLDVMVRRFGSWGVGIDRTKVGLGFGYGTGVGKEGIGLGVKRSVYQIRSNRGEEVDVEVGMDGMVDWS